MELRDLYGCEAGLQAIAAEFLGFNIVKAQRPGMKWTSLPLHDPQIQYAADDAWLALRIMWAWLEGHRWRDITIEHGLRTKRQLKLAEGAAEQLPPRKRAAPQGIGRAPPQVAAGPTLCAPRTTMEEASRTQILWQPAGRLCAEAAAGAARVVSAVGARLSRRRPAATHPQGAAGPGVADAPASEATSPTATARAAPARSALRAASPSRRRRVGISHAFAGAISAIGRKKR